MFIVKFLSSNIFHVKMLNPDKKLSFKCDIALNVQHL